jgi:hypothetical protein
MHEAERPDHRPMNTSEKVALDLTRPFTLRDGLAAGLSRAKLRGPQFRRLFHDVYVDAKVAVGPALLAEAAVLRSGAGFVSHTSAAAVLGIPVPASDLQFVTVAREADRCRVIGIRCVVRRGRSRLVGRIQVSESAQLFVELAELLPLVDLVVAGDHMLHVGLTSRALILEECRTSAAPGVARALEALPYLSARAESPMESRMRMLLVLAGLPAFRVNLSIVDDQGRELRRHDLGLPEAKVAVEYQGAQHRKNQRIWEDDYERQEASQIDGWLQIHVTSKGIFREPERTILRVAEALKSRGVRVGPINPRWRRHFPTRFT